MSDTPTYPLKAIAALLLLTPRRVQQLAQDGVIPRTGRGRYELEPSVQGYVKYLKDRTIGRELGPDDVHAHKRKLLETQADLAVLDLEQKRGKLVDLETVRVEWGRIVDQLAGALGAFPSSAAPRVVGSKNLRQATSQLEEAVRELQADIHRTYGGNGVEKRPRRVAKKRAKRATKKRKRVKPTAAKVGA